MKALRKITTNSRTYIESVGRTDELGLFSALQGDGEGTVIRACLWRSN